MKYFSLIQGGDITLSQKKDKVIKKEAFSQLLEAKELLEKVEEDILLYKKSIEKECEQIKAEAHKKGLEEGFKEWAKKLQEFDPLLNKAKEDMEKLIVPIAIKAAKKIVGKEMELHPDIVVDMVKEALKSVSQHKYFTIYVNKQDADLFEENRSRLKENLDLVQSLNIKVKDDIKAGNALIETESGIINLDQEQLWQSLETLFASLMK